MEAITIVENEIYQINLRGVDVAAVCQALEGLPYRVAKPPLDSIMGQLAAINLASQNVGSPAETQS